MSMTKEQFQARFGAALDQLEAVVLELERVEHEGKCLDCRMLTVVAVAQRLGLHPLAIIPEDEELVRQAAKGASHG